MIQEAIYWLPSVIYWIALLVIIIGAVIAACDREIWVGPLGSLLLLVIAVSAARGFEHPPREWITTMLAAMAAKSILGYLQWRRYLKKNPKVAQSIRDENAV